MYFENAAISVDMALRALEREGHIEAAETLYGLEVMSPAGAEVALDTLRRIHVDTPDSMEAVAFARSAVVQALASRQPAAA